MTELVKNEDVKPVFIRRVEDVDTIGDVRTKPMLTGEQMTLLEIKYPPGAGAPPHVHSHETLCYVVEGRVRVIVGDEEFEMGQGDTCRHPMGVPHGIRGIEHATVLEIKSPAQPIAQFLKTSDH